MSNQVNKPATAGIALKVGIILAEIMLLFIFNVFVFVFLLSVISIPVEVRIFVVFLLLTVVSSIVVYHLGRKIGRHQGSYLFVLLGSGLGAVILLDIIFPIMMNGRIPWGILLTGIPIVGAIVGFYVKREEKKVSKKIVGLALTGIIAVGLIGYAVIDIYAITEFKNEIQRIKEKGEPIDFEDFINFEDFVEAPVSDEKNSAPIYCEILSLLDTNFNQSGKLSQEMAKVREVDSIDFNEWTEKQKQEIPIILAKYNKIFELMHKASLKPYCDFSIDNTDLNRMRGEFRNNISLLSVKSALDKENGQIEEAVERIYDGFAEARALGVIKYHSTYDSEIVHSKIMFDRLAMLLADRDISLQSYQRLYDTLKKQREQRKADFLNGVYSERCNVCLSLRQSQLSMSNHRSWQFKVLLNLISIRTQMNGYDRAIEMIKNPYWDQKDKQTTLGAIAFASQILNRFSSVNAKFELAELAIALRIYRDKTGTYPASLKELVPDIVQKLPVDPYSGKDFVYSLERKGFIVYILGKNAKDDHGKQDDIVWKSVI